MRLYISGPMGGIEGHNHAAFDDCKIALLDLGHEVVSPADLDRERDENIPTTPDAATRARLLKDDTRYILECDGIVLLDGWYDSKGANYELCLALSLGMRTYSWHNETLSEFYSAPDYEVLESLFNDGQLVAWSDDSRPTVPLIGLCGKAGAGKDYTAKMMGEAWPRMAFADELKREVNEILGVPGSLLHHPYTPEMRRLLQWWGAELRRAEDEDYWVKKLRPQIEYELGPTGDGMVVITDVRYRNEAQMVKDLGGTVVEVVASEGVRRERLGRLPPAHSSEEMDFDDLVDMKVESLGGLPWPKEFQDLVTSMEAM